MQADKSFTVTTDIMLRRSDFAVEGDFSPSVLSRVFYVSYEVERRFEADRQRPHTLIISFSETANNIQELSDIVLGNIEPETLSLITKTKTGRVISRRAFTNLRLKSASASYAVHGEQEVPLQRLVFDCYLADVEFPKS